MTCIATIALTIISGFADAAPRTVPATQKIRPEHDGPQYQPQETRALEDLPGFSPSEGRQRSKFGGDLSAAPLAATGFFRTEKVDGRWWLVDPEGRRTINTGVTSTNLRLSDRMKATFDKKFGDEKTWAAETRDFLFENGFDGSGCWSDDDKLNAGATKRLVHTRFLGFMSNYGKERGGTFAEAGHTGYPNKCIFVFDPEFETFCDKFAAKLAQYKDDPYLLGYFSDNELPFPLDSLDRYLQLPESDHGRIAAEAFVKTRSKPLTAADREAWNELVGERYFSVVSRAIKKHDPNHLYLGSRMYGTDHRNPGLMRGAGRHFDVMSYNYYGVWTPKIDRLNVWENLANKPILITEFYAKGHDTGMGNRDGAGWLVPTQDDRGLFYQNLIIGLIESRVVVGWHYFKYIDNDPMQADKVNPSDSNKGMLTRDFEPYTPMLKRMKAVNDARYDLVEYFDKGAAAKD